jgi:proton glutamate symport protein
MQEKKSAPDTLTLATLILSFLAAVIFILQKSGIVEITHEVRTLSRWLAITFIIIYGVKKRSLTLWIFIAMIAGIEVGHDFKEIASYFKIFSDIFLKLIKSIIAPLLFGTLVVGIAGHSNIKQVGRMGLKALLYFEIVTTIALFLGLAAINVSKAGNGIERIEVSQESVPKTQAQNWKEIILHIFPENFAKSIVENQVLQIVIFSIIFGIALARLSDNKKKPFLDFADSLSEIMFKFTDLIMYVAPVGVFGAIAYTIANMGLGVLVNLFQLLLTLYVSLILFVLGVLLPIALILKIDVKRFIKTLSEPISIAFATASSEAALPRAMEKLVEFGVPKKIVAFVLPTGYSFNLDGTTLYLSLASVFVAQAAGVPLTFGQQIIMVFTLMLTSKGVAGVPRASLVILLGTAASFNLPEWPIYIILGIDTLMDMARTAVNVTGNCLAAVVVAKWEGELSDQPIEINE